MSYDKLNKLPKWNSIKKNVFTSVFYIRFYGCDLLITFNLWNHTVAYVWANSIIFNVGLRFVIKLSKDYNYDKNVFHNAVR